MLQLSVSVPLVTNLLRLNSRSLETPTLEINIVSLISDFQDLYIFNLFMLKGDLIHPTVQVLESLRHNSQVAQ